MWAMSKVEATEILADIADQWLENMCDTFHIDGVLLNADSTDSDCRELARDMAEGTDPAEIRQIRDVVRALEVLRKPD